MPQSVAVVGTGLIGRSWSIVFARAGWNVRLFDPLPEVAENVTSWMDSALKDFGIDLAGRNSICSRVTVCETLESSLSKVDYVQENASEDLSIKTTLYRELDRLAPPGIPIASSTSALMPSRFCAAMERKGRGLVAHPVNPPHLVPLVEIVPSVDTEKRIVTQVHDIMTSIDQKPITINKEVPGFVLNRLQAALINEAMSLCAADIASVEDIDKCVRHGLGNRWAFIGPFETMDLNADGGIAEYTQKFKELYEGISAEMTACPWSDELLHKVTSQRRGILSVEEVSDRQCWRDRQLIALTKYKVEHDIA
jgi:3-hydroxyacyl-CoA dehydrogenase